MRATSDTVESTVSIQLLSLHYMHSLLIAEVTMLSLCFAYRFALCGNGGTEEIELHNIGVTNGIA